MSLLRPILFIAFFVLGSFCSTSWAEPDTGEASKMYLQIGHGEEIDALTLGLQLPWSRAWLGDESALQGYWDLSIGQWKNEEPFGHARSLSNQIGVHPTLRHVFAEDSLWFVEGSMGLDLITPRFERNGLVQATALNFGESLGVGIKLGAQQTDEISAHIMHNSNGDLRKPNPGENFLCLRYAFGF